MTNKDKVEDSNKIKPDQSKFKSTGETMCLLQKRTTDSSSIFKRFYFDGPENRSLCAGICGILTHTCTQTNNDKKLSCR